MGTLGAKTSQWHPGHVPYLSYPRYATDEILRYYTFNTIFFNWNIVESGVKHQKPNLNL
jgi:hypothetical protein